jgi:hypothetical protein
MKSIHSRRVVSLCLLVTTLTVWGCTTTSAVELRTDEPVALVGHCPRYLAGDFLLLLRESGTENTKVVVEKVNQEAPMQLLLLCTLTADWPENFLPCSGVLYEALA